MIRGIQSVNIAGVVVDPIMGKKEQALMKPEAPMATVKIKHNDQVILERTLTRKALNGETLRYGIHPPIHPKNKPIYFIFESSEDAPYIVISSASVSEQNIPSDSPLVNP